ncbi:MAG TPA: mechanosensitive ion channel, partial [Tepidisphaeraceae bacterium]|nr:mechanosensitive ion channel [Tepidisphaeraceae bacterium]
MLRKVLFIALLGLLLTSLCMAQNAPATSQPAPATQQVVIVPMSSITDNQTLVEKLKASTFGQVIEGQRTLTWNDVKDPLFWLDTFKDLVVTIVAFIPRFMGTLVFLFVFWLIYRGIRRMVMGSMKRGDVDSSIRDLLGAMIKWAVMGFGVVIACNQLGIPIVAMLTGVSIIGLAVGFAAQETLANFIAGMVIFIDKPFRVGDWIQIDGVFGQVKRVTFRSTRLLTLDGEYNVFPNTQMLSTKLANLSTHPINRVTIPIGIAYKESIDKARQTLLALTKDDDRLVKEPPAEVVVKECADSSVNLLLRFWVADESLEHRIVYEYLEKAKNALDAAGIEIPFPHMQLFIENTPAVA